MDTILDLANYYQFCRGEFQWRTLAWLSLGVVLFSMFWQFRLGRKGLTPARSILTIMAVGYPVLVFMSIDIFDFVTIEPDVLFPSVIGCHLLVMILLKWVYDVGRTTLRKFLCFLYPLLLVGGSLMVLVAYYLLGSDFAERDNMRFDVSTQEKKNKYFTCEQLSDRTGIADWPQFDVQVFHRFVYGPDETYEIELLFKQSLTKSQIKNLEYLCEHGKWKKRLDVYEMAGSAKEKDNNGRWEYSLFVDPKARKLIIRDSSY